MSKRLLGLALAIGFAIGADAQSQLQPDRSFNSCGSQLLTEPATGWAGFRMCVAKSGSVFIAGAHGTDSLNIWKLKPNGTVDVTFGKGGYQSFYLNGYTPSAFHFNILLQRDGKIVAMADGDRAANPSDNSESAIILARVNADGSIDQSFGEKGLVIHKPDPNFQFSPLAVTIDSSGATDKLYVSALAVENGNASCPLGMGKWSIVKYNTNGSLDAGFNQKGYLLEDAAYIKNGTTKSPLAMVLALKVLEGGKLLAAGAFHAEDSSFFMFRLTGDGTFDEQFGSKGRIFRPFGYTTIASNQRTSAQIAEDGSAIFATHQDYYGSTSYDSSLLYLVRCNSDGSADNSFGRGGILTVSYVTEGHHQYYVDKEGRVLVYWNQNVSGKQYMRFKSYTASGQANLAFGTLGYESVEPIIDDPALYTSLYDMLWNGDGKLLALSRRFDLINKAHIGVFQFAELATGSSTTSVGKQKELEVRVRPQPAHDYLDVELPGDRLITVSIINAMGQMVFFDKSQLKGSKRIFTGDFARGIYLLRLQDSEGSVVTRSIVLE